MTDRCAHCDREFEVFRISDEEARAACQQRQERRPLAPNDGHILCDDCYWKLLMKMLAAPV